MTKTKAPMPGVSTREEAAEHDRQILCLRIGDDTWRLAWRNLPLSERMLVRKWTGLPYQTFLATGETIDADSLALLWCLARRAEGETSLQFNDALVDAYEARLVAAGGDIDVVVEDPDTNGSDDPEA